MSLAKRTSIRSLCLSCVMGVALTSCVVACDDDDDDPSFPGNGHDEPDSGGASDAAPPPPPPPPDWDAAVPDAGWDAGMRSDAGPRDGGPRDGGPPDGGFGDAAYFEPDGGVVLRPVEEAFREEYLERLELPEGFQIEVYAMPGGQTRMLAVHANAVYVTRPMQGDVLRLTDEDADGRADTETTAVAGWPTIHGIAFDGDVVYLATPTEVIRGEVAADGSFDSLEVLADDLPDGGQHPLRTLGIGPDGLLYVSVGSSCGACPESNPEHATLLQFGTDGSSRSIFASGLRNTIGFGWQPDTLELWGMDNGSDWRGNELPPEELNRIEQGNDYGWPYCFDDQVDPIIGDPPGQTKEEYCASTEPPVLTWQAHEAPIGLTFYDATAFPAGYRGDAFVAMHGSWNRIPATGYSVVRIDFIDGRPTRIGDFVDGFLAPDGLSTFGRPAGITTHSDGSLLFSDDSNGVLYRVTRSEP